MSRAAGLLAAAPRSTGGVGRHGFRLRADQQREDAHNDGQQPEPWRHSAGGPGHLQLRAKGAPPVFARRRAPPPILTLRAARGQTYDREFLIRVSYLEIYQECIRDLFKPEDDDLKLHEHPEQGFYVKATEVMVASEEEIMQLMDSGEAHRHVGQTNMNEKSSRSHTLFRITIESKVEIADDGEVSLLALPPILADV